MIILGIDPGIAIVGWGVIDYNGMGTKIKPVAFGSITTPSEEKTEDRIYTRQTASGRSLRRGKNRSGSGSKSERLCDAELWKKLS